MGLKTKRPTKYGTVDVNKMKDPLQKGLVSKSDDPQMAHYYMLT